MIEILVPLEAIQANPWQPRESEDQDHIQALAMSIHEDGLLQKPVGRLVTAGNHAAFALSDIDFYGMKLNLRAMLADATPAKAWEKVFAPHKLQVELAFGHSRLAAYQRLREAQEISDVKGDWTIMPIIVRDLTNEEMFRFAITENIQRKSLNAIEEAKAMAFYRDDFEKTSAEIGELFGLSDSAVRNKMRLLKLPDFVQDMLRKRSISEGVGRVLVNLFEVPQRKLDMVPDDVDEILVTAENGGTPAQITEMVDELVNRIHPQPKQLSILDLPKPGDIQAEEEETEEDFEMDEPLPDMDPDFYAEGAEPIETDLPDESESVSVETVGQPQELPELTPMMEEEPDAPSVPGQPLGAALTINQIADEKKSMDLQEDEPKNGATVTTGQPLEAAQTGPKTWEESQIHISLTFWPDDGNDLGRMVSVGVRLNDNLPKVSLMREINLDLPESIQQILDGVKMEVMA
ncbi:MAG: hypothetical protein CL609_23700 [Anaerolineaceae bacterium]|nr:hypothetical protein [Anaerolineaceae bacterium]